MGVGDDDPLGTGPMYRVDVTCTGVHRTRGWCPGSRVTVYTSAHVHTSVGVGGNGPECVGAYTGIDRVHRCMNE